MIDPCPWCGDEITDNESDFIVPCGDEDGGEVELECGGCGKPVMIELHIRWNYTTKKASADTPRQEKPK